MARDLAAHVKTGRLLVHLKLDSGMTRLGITPEALPRFLDAFADLPQLELEGVFSHFGDADSVATLGQSGGSCLFSSGSKTT